MNGLCETFQALSLCKLLLAPSSESKIKSPLGSAYDAQKMIVNISGGNLAVALEQEPHVVEARRHAVLVRPFLSLQKVYAGAVAIYRRANHAVVDGWRCW